MGGVMHRDGLKVRHLGLRAVAIVLSIFLVFGQAACTTTRVLSVSGTAPSELQPGQTVTLYLKDGTATQAEIKALGSTGLTTGDGRRIAWAQIERIEQRRVSPGRTTGAVVAVVIVCIAVLAVAFANAMDDIDGDDFFKAAPQR